MFLLLPKFHLLLVMLLDAEKNFIRAFFKSSYIMQIFEIFLLRKWYFICLNFDHIVATGKFSAHNKLIILLGLNEQTIMCLNSLNWLHIY